MKELKEKWNEGEKNVLYFNYVERKERERERKKSSDNESLIQSLDPKVGENLLLRYFSQGN